MKETNDSWQGFVNIRFDAQHRKAVKALAETLDNVNIHSKIEEWLDDGYKITFTRDEANDAVIVSLTGVNGNVNSGFTMSQRHRDLTIAVAAVIFAHEELAQRDAWQNVEFDWRSDDW